MCSRAEKATQILDQMANHSEDEKEIDSNSETGAPDVLPDKQARQIPDH